MKPVTLPIVCGAALAIMAGAASTHFMSVRQIIEIAKNSADPMPALTEPMSETEALIAQLKQENQSLEGTLQTSRAALTANGGGGTRLPSKPGTKTHQLLSELVAMNRELRNQVAETNRDMMELQFRVDTHSEQFRPLNITEQQLDDPLGASEYDTSIGVLPPMDMR